MRQVYVPAPEIPESINLADVNPLKGIFVKMYGRLVGMLNNEYSPDQKKYVWYIAIEGQQAGRDGTGQQAFQTRTEAALGALSGGYTLWIEED